MTKELEVQSILKVAGRAVVLASHNRFKSIGLDNSEYIPWVRDSINGLADACAEIIGSSAATTLRTELTDYARKLFVDLWVQLAREDEDCESPELEREVAQTTFDEILREEP